MSKRERKNLKRRMIRTGERMYAWYSADMEKIQGGHAVYKRPDGTQVKVTVVGKDRECFVLWDDVKYLGKVIGYKFGGFVKSSIRPLPFLNHIL